MGCVNSVVSPIKDSRSLKEKNMTECKESQPTVFLSPHTTNGLFYWISLRKEFTSQLQDKKHANNKKRLEELSGIKNACANIDQTKQRINNPSGLVVGVGFGEKFVTQVGLKKTFNYQEWTKESNKKIVLLPKTEYGDIFVHAKGCDVGSLFEFQQLFKDCLPKGVIDESTTKTFRGFLYKDHRDISGFIDGIVNPLTTQDQRSVAVDPATGGSFVITQRWDHDMEVINNADANYRNGWIGRTRWDAKLLDSLPKDSHVALMKLGKQMVRQAMPITEDEKPGSFFIAYAESTKIFDDHLQRMTANNGDQLFIMSKNTMGAYWYFPGLAELKNLAN